MIEKLTGKTHYTSPCFISPNIVYLVPNRFGIGGRGQGGDMLTITAGVNNIANPAIETWLYFARHPEELQAFMREAPAPEGKKPGPEILLAEDGMVTMSQGVWAAMQWAPEID